MIQCDHAALRRPEGRSCHVERSGCRVPTGKDELFERNKSGVRCVDFALHARRVPFGDKRDAEVALSAWAMRQFGTDDQQHSLADYQQAKLIALVFTCNHCPVAQAYEDRLIKLQKDYRSKGVRLIAVNVNNIAPDRLEPMKQRAAEKQFNFPYLYDSSQKMGHDYGAKVTPHVFVLCKKRKIAYVGAVDDSNNPKKAEKHYLRDALDALLAGKTPETTTTPPRGCSVKYEK